MNLGGLKNLLFLTIVLFIAKNTFGQTSISGVINNYTAVTAIGCNYVTASSVASFSAGDKVLIIQMQGATINLSNATIFGDLSPATTGIGNSGNYEFNEILNISGNTVNLKYRILSAYTATGSVQLISIPQYTDVNIVGTLTAKAWDGTTGGVLVFQASGTVTLNADIDVSYLGFRGGIVSIDDKTYGCTNTTSPFSISNNYFYAQPSAQGGQKGEGIAIVVNGAGRGKQANGGGGGNGHNSGGAGGGNYGLGGNGGNKDSRNAALGCSGGCGNGLYPNGQGIGGFSLNTQYNSNKIFMGGGGGGGQEDDHLSFTAGSAGGIVIITANTVNNGGTYSIISKGGSVAYNQSDAGDGNSGGGAGGTILLSATNLSNVLTIDATGGKGGDTNGGGFLCRYFGPGGGGGGGVVWLNDASNTNIKATVSGGAPGFSHSYGTSYGATAGGDGAVLTSLSIPQSTTIFNLPCSGLPVTLLTFVGEENAGNTVLKWATATEINNDHFVIEKSNDGIVYEYLTSIAGHGNSNVVRNYSYTDQSTLIGLNYYRLKQYDYNSLEHISGYVAIRFEEKEIIIEKIYPNPFSNELIIQTSKLLDKSKTSIRIINLLGAEMTSVTYHFEGQIIKMNANALESGIYYLQLICEDKIEIRKISKE